MQQEGVQLLKQSFQDTNEFLLLVTVGSLVLLTLLITTVFFFVFFQKRKTQLLIEKAEVKARFDQELVKSQMEIQEQTFKNISWELHDNVGQLLSVAKMQLNILATQVPQAQQESLQDVGEVVGTTLQEIRRLSKSLNNDVINAMGLIKVIEVELERFRKMKFLETDLQIIGEEVVIDHKEEIIIFRILQEFFSNVIKHAKAESLHVHINYLKDTMVIVAKDNGVGFDVTQQAEGSGLINMNSRAELIGATLSITSKKGQGVQLWLEYPILN